jgi:hypothetical protein
LTPLCRQFLRLRIRRVADDFALDQVNDFFGNIGGMIGQAFQVAGD